MNEMAVHEAMGRATLEQLASAPTSRPANVANEPPRLGAQQIINIIEVHDTVALDQEAAIAILFDGAW
jgi:hypothetical protein